MFSQLYNAPNNHGSNMYFDQFINSWFDRKSASFVSIMFTENTRNLVLKLR